MRPPHLLRNLKLKNVQKLAELLSLPPMLQPTDPSWLRAQKSLIDKISLKLLKPDALLLRLAMHLPGTPPKAILCKTHKPLNPYLIHDIFLLVTAEVTTQLSTLTSAAELPESIRVFVKRLQSINSLWVSAEAYRVSFQAMPDEERYERIEGDCEACILARIGGSEQMVCGLRATLLGRRKKRTPEPRLLLLVEAWFECFDSKKTKEEIRARSESMAREVRRCRREMQLERKAAKRVVDPRFSREKDEEKGLRSPRMKTWTIGGATLVSVSSRDGGAMYAVMSGGRSQAGDGNRGAGEEEARLFYGSVNLPGIEHVGEDEEPLLRDGSDSEDSFVTERPEKRISGGHYDVLIDHKRDEQDDDNEYKYVDRETGKRLTSARSRAPEIENEEDDDSVWTEESITKYYYNNLPATQKRQADLRNSIHPGLSNQDSATLGSLYASRYTNSIIFDPASGTFQRRPQAQPQAQSGTQDSFLASDPEDEHLVPAPLAPLRPSRYRHPNLAAATYSESGSNYDLHDYNRNSTTLSGALPEASQRNAEDHARYYRNLVDEEEEGMVSPTTAPAAASSSANTARSDARQGNGESWPVSPQGDRRASNAGSNSTRWTDFYD